MANRLTPPVSRRDDRCGEKRTTSSTTGRTLDYSKFMDDPRSFIEHHKHIDASADRRQISDLQQRVSSTRSTRQIMVTDKLQEVSENRPHLDVSGDADESSDTRKTKYTF